MFLQIWETKQERIISNIARRQDVGVNENRVIWDVEIRGGNILSGSAVCRDDFIKADTNANGRADKVTFTRGDNGKYISQTLPVSAEAPSIFEVWFVNSGNDMFFALSSENGVYATYELQYGDISDYGMMTDYGFVPKDQIDPDNYPLLLFKNGAYIGRSDVLYDKLNASATKPFIDIYIKEQIDFVTVINSKTCG